MNKSQAHELEDYISLDRKDAFVYQLANGAYCVRLKNPVYFLWSMEDWLTLRQDMEDKSRAKGKKSAIGAV